MTPAAALVALWEAVSRVPLSPLAEHRERIGQFMAELEVVAPVVTASREAVSDPECETCDGTGKVLDVYGGDMPSVPHPCPDCSGRSAPTDEDVERGARALMEDGAFGLIGLSTPESAARRWSRAVLDSLHTPTGELRACSLCDTKTDKLYGGEGKYPAQCWGCWTGRGLEDEDAGSHEAAAKAAWAGPPFSRSSGADAKAEGAEGTPKVDLP